MFFKKRTEQIKTEMLKQIEEILPLEASIVSFDYKRIFCNIAVTIKVKNFNHVFTTDRGEIYHNGKMLCDNSYRYIEKEDTFPKLLQLIKRELDL